MAHDDLIARADEYLASLTPGLRDAAWNQLLAELRDALEVSEGSVVLGELVIHKLKAEVVRLRGERDQARTELEEFQRGVYNMGATHRRRIDT